MSTAFAAAEARLGASTLRRLGNASITLADATVIDGMLQNGGRQPMVGIGMQARDIEFSCPLTAADNLTERATVTLNYRGTSTSMTILRRLPDDVHLQHACIALRRVS